jgi:hypothetical protein
MSERPLPRKISVFDELNTLLQSSGNPQSKESVQLLDRITMEMNKIPKDHAPTYAYPHPAIEEESEEIEADDALQREYADILQNIERVQRLAIDQMNVVDKVNKSQSILLETMDMQRSVLRRCIHHNARSSTEKTRSTEHRKSPERRRVEIE